jgi:hypothetical protein
MYLRRTDGYRETYYVRKARDGRKARDERKASVVGTVELTGLLSDVSSTQYVWCHFIF